MEPRDCSEFYEGEEINCQDCGTCSEFYEGEEINCQDCGTEHAITYFPESMSFIACRLYDDEDPKEVV
jgi:hypothetical protein